MGILKQTLQYGTMCVALMAGMGAERMYEKSRGLDSKVQQMPVRKPREPCEIARYYSEPAKESPPLNIPEKAVYTGLLILGVAFVANEIKRKHDEQLEQRTQKKWHAENFFGNKDDYNF